MLKIETLIPWHGGESLYNYIKSNLDETGCLSREHEQLPDEDEFYKGEKVRWASGAMDGVCTHHMGLTDNPQIRMNTIIQLLRKQISSRNVLSRRATYLEILNGNFLDFIDPFLESLRKQSDINLRNLREEAIWFATQGRHRNVVKFGIALLGLIKCDDNSDQIDILMTLGKHNEFTLYSSVAIMNSNKNSNQSLFELAKKVDGWGKIHLVERLKADTDDIKSWLLRYGCANCIMNEYLAYTCAVKGDLKEALHNNNIDQDLYRGAGIIINALICGGPAEGIDDYEHSRLVVVDYINLSEHFAADLKDLLVLGAIQNYLEDEQDLWEKRYQRGWTQQAREDALKECHAIINNGEWQQFIWQNIGSKDSVAQYNAIQASRLLGIDIWTALFEHVKSNPYSSNLYYDLMRTDDEKRIKAIVGFAEATFPLDKLTGEPKDELGLGKDFELYHCLDFILQELHKHEGIGKKLLLTGLRSQVTRTRNMALKVLKSWRVEYWPDQTINILTRLADTEPNEKTKDMVNDLLRKDT